MGKMMKTFERGEWYHWALALGGGLALWVVLRGVTRTAGPSPASGRGQPRTARRGGGGGK